MARDLLDHQLLDREDEACGRIDDLWVDWGERSAHLGAVLSGGGVLVGELGWAGRLFAGTVRGLGGASLLRYREIPWGQVRRVERQAIKLRVRRDELDGSIAGPSSGGESLTGRSRYAALARGPVLDRDGERLGVLDLRTTLPGPETAPRVLGLVAAPRRLLGSMGLKRHDTTSLPLSRIAEHARFVPWSEIAAVTEAGIALRTGFGGLPPLADAPDPGPPPVCDEESQAQ